MTVRIPPGTQHGSTIRVHGHGVTSWPDDTRGSLVLQIHVDVPPKLSDRALALVAELNAELLSSMAQNGVAHGPGAAPAATPEPIASAQSDQEAKKRFLDNLPLRDTS